MRRSRSLALFLVILLISCMAQEIRLQGPGNPGAGDTSSGNNSPLFLTLVPGSASLAIGASVPLSLTVRDSSGAVLNLAKTWTTDRPTVATVSTGGVVQGVGQGTARITGASGGLSAVSTVSVVQTPVASVTMTPPSATVQVNFTAQLSAVPRDASGTALAGRPITWSTSNAGVATVSVTGLVTARAVGPATITATSEGQSGTSAVTVVNIPVASVSVTPASGTVFTGSTLQLTATPRDAANAPLTGRVVTWSSSATAVATVNSSGRVTGVTAGSVTITATSEGQNGTAAITVTVPPVATVVVSPGSPSIPMTTTRQMSATLRDAAGNVLTGRVVTWSTSNAAIADVNATGLVSGVAVGSATITATSETITGSTTATVTPVPVATVTVAPNPASVVGGQTVQLTPTTLDAGGNVLTGRAVSWASANQSIARVNATGLVTGVAAGNTTITATSEGRNGTAQVNVSPAPVATVDVTPNPASVTVGQTAQLTATPRDAAGNALGGRVVTWSSSNTLLATVNGTGTVGGVAVGSLSMTATSEGQSGSTTVNVVAAPPPGTSWPNEPPGFVVEIDRSFATLNGNVDDIAGGNWWYQPYGNGAIVTNETGDPVSGPTALRTTLPASGNGGAWQATATLSGASEWYLGYTFKLDPNWQGHSPDGVLKVLWLGASPDQLVTKADGTGSNIFFQITTEMNTPPNGTNNFASFALNKGQWYKVEIYAKYPATRGGTGTITVWINGVQRYTSTTVRLTDQGPNEVSVLPYVGGVGGSTSGGRDVFYGHLRISTAP